VHGPYGGAVRGPRAAAACTGPMAAAAQMPVELGTLHAASGPNHKAGLAPSLTQAPGMKKFDGPGARHCPRPRAWKSSTGLAPVTGQGMGARAAAPTASTGTAVIGQWSQRLRPFL
jgi:hypothetical protein